MIVRGHQERTLTLSRVSDEQVERLALVSRVQIARRLIRQENLGLDNECPANRDPLALSLRKLLRILCQVVHHPCQLGKFSQAFLQTRSHPAQIPRQ